MTSKRKDGRVWQPLERAERVHSPQVLEMARADPLVAAALRETESGETWMNHTYVVHVRRHPEEGHVVRLSIRRQDRRPANDWRDLQRIKNQLAGPETEAINLHPAESRLVDSANQTWLWVMPPGVTLPLGFASRVVSTPAEAARYGAVQRRLDEVS